MKTAFEFDPFTHNPRAAIAELAESPALEATLSWNGGNDYRTGPSAKYAPLDVGHREILTASELRDWCDGDLSPENLDAAAQWAADSQQEWFGQEEETA